MAYDEKCLQLAEYFLDVHAKRIPNTPNAMVISGFAQHIQDACEDWLRNEREYQRSQIPLQSWGHQ